MTNGEYIGEIVEQDEDYCILKDDVVGTVTIEVSIGWWNKSRVEIDELEQESCITMRDLSDKELKHFAEEMKKVRPQVIEQQHCKDAISRAEFMKRIKPYDTEDKMDKELYNFAHNIAISCSSVQPQPRWIPVSERLPMMGDTFLVTIEYKGEVIGVDAASYSPVEGYIDKHWDTFNDWKEDDDSCYHVTAWVPLPEPYKTETKIEQGLSFGDQDTMMPAT